MRLMLAHPGADWSTHDVFEGLRHGLKHHGAEVIDYRLNNRIEIAHKVLHAQARIARKRDKTSPKPTDADIIYHACIGALEKALRHQVDAVIVVSAMYFHPDVLTLMKRAGLKVFVLLTETPYDIDKELTVAAIVDGVWTNERSAVSAFKAVNLNSGYLPHGWHPVKHNRDFVIPEEIPSHDVVFVGTGFSDRISFFNGIDWSGIDLGLYGTWDAKFGLRKDLIPCVKSEQVDNSYAAALYRKAKIGLNLYRAFAGWGRTARRVHGDSLSPRAYELAKCGCFHISAYRAEVAEIFGDLVPTFTTAGEAESLIRKWLPDAHERQRVADQLPACVAEASWIERSKVVLGDLQSALSDGALAACG